MMVADLTSKRIIWTADAIAKYLGVSKHKFYSLVKAGLPAIVIDGTWCAHADNLETFFQRGTARVTKDIPAEAE
jgi:hypothetical protein